MEVDRKEHWENIYQTKQLHEVSWFQPEPIHAIQYLQELNIPTNAHIIDIGGGDSFFVDYLLENNYEHISVLDISEQALLRAQNRLGQNAHRVNWICADITNFKSEYVFDFWYDRAAFHFLTEPADIDTYVQIASKHLAPQGQLIIGTFSETGPKKCSGIPIKQYNATSLEATFASNFTCLSCQQKDHATPFDTLQNFIFCVFQKT